MRIKMLALAAILASACGGMDPQQLSETGSNLAAAPSILALNRTGSPEAGGMIILIAGTNLDAAAAVTFDGVPALSVALDPNASSTVATVLNVVTPPHAEGFVDMVVTNPDGQSATFINFHYGPPPSISTLAPSTNVRKGDLVTMTGANFGATYVVQVSVGGMPAQIVSKSDTQLVFAVPKQNAGTYQVFVFNWDSQYAVSPVLLSYRQ